MFMFGKLGRLGSAIPAAALFAFLSPTALAQPEQTEAQEDEKLVFRTPPPVGELGFTSVLYLNQLEQEASPQLRGATIAKTANWPASLYATYLASDGKTYACTATLVGPSAVLTAAHCIPSSRQISFAFKDDTFRADCVMHEDYLTQKDDSADYALCEITNSNRGMTSITMIGSERFETIDQTPMDEYVTPGSSTNTITLTGFGCTSDTVGLGRPDGEYRIGGNRFVESSNTNTLEYGPQYYLPEERNNLITSDANDVANICPGDSGGAAFTAPGKGRKVVGVNSRVFYTNRSQTRYGASLISATGSPGFLGWAREWARDRDLVVCGLWGSSEQCQQ